MINKQISRPEDAISRIKDGDVVAIGGFGGAGAPNVLIDSLIENSDAKDLTIVSNNAGQNEEGIAALLKTGKVSKIVCSFPRMKNAYVFEELYRNGELKLELVPQGNLAERLRARGAGIGAFFTPTGYGTALAEGKETREIDGIQYVLEHPIKIDVALIKAKAADRFGNLVYNKTARNFGPVMAMAADITIVEVSEVAQTGELDPENIVTPGIYVDYFFNIGGRSDLGDKRWKS
ncbi:3-oxoacid CoA-transferase subunit A [Marinobacter sp. 1_MG-2023]|uniref:3-oxoacid CoA-transferase subunit A n=1 Tax=Marinobacter sp. 1_MG-2023 TaxID=3062627 RepID=UPI0026E2AFFC|nr:3-oxoacid CoA-transferase subunit A [Marinobacter sp. 1_MG-2023]MDO6822764.1 3-oxoacid CoA-transferase subunit A [Marinobacter sp. 1_MG-2023]